jgi:3-hydroxyacyl-[acyl-carrier-protein] dehydratase
MTFVRPSKKGNIMKQYNIQEIMNHLPHRYPFLLVDRILKLVPDQSVVALKNVTVNEPFFQGHFPGVPIMPGVLILEALAQAGGVLACLSSIEGIEGSLVYFTGIDKARFRKPVTPGDQLILEAKITKVRSRIIKLSGVAKVNDEKVAEADLMAAIGEKL